MTAIQTEHRDYPAILEHWNNRVSLFREHKSALTQRCIMLFGDSITEAFPVEDYYPDGRVVDRGIAGDTIRGLTLHFAESVHGTNPAGIFILIGINDTYRNGSWTIDYYVPRYKELLRRVKNECPDTPVYIVSLLPAKRPDEGRRRLTGEINAELKRMTESCGFTFLDMHSVFEDKDGYLAEEFTDDGVHVTPRGYETWKEIIDPLIDRIVNSKSDS